MRKLVRLGFAAIACIAWLVVPTPSHALQTLTWEFVLDCNSPAVSSTAPMFELPTGVYVFTLEGACTIDHTTTVPPRTYTLTTGTPCNVPVGGTPIPCLTPTVSNVPGPFCSTMVGPNYLTSCRSSGPALTTDYCTLVFLNGTCLESTAGTFEHDGGPMTAQYVDSIYGDNVGAYTVTVEWTHL